MISDLLRYDHDRMQPGIVLLSLIPFWYLGFYLQRTEWGAVIFVILSAYLALAQFIILDDIIRLLSTKDGRDHLAEFMSTFSEVRAKVKLALAMWVFGIPLHWYLLFQTPEPAHVPLMKLNAILTVLCLLPRKWLDLGSLFKKKRK